MMTRLCITFLDLHMAKKLVGQMESKMFVEVNWISSEWLEKIELSYHPRVPPTIYL